MIQVIIIMVYYVLDNDNIVQDQFFLIVLHIILVCIQYERQRLLVCIQRLESTFIVRQALVDIQRTKHVKLVCIQFIQCFAMFNTYGYFNIWQQKRFY